MSDNPGSDMRPYTEISALGDILAWSRDRPDWLRDALRRLMVGSEFSDLDIDELEAICLGTGGDASPLSGEHIAPQRLAGKPVAITGLSDPVAVNALAGGQGISFAATGLTIVYGDNGWEIGLCAYSQECVLVTRRQDIHLAGRKRCRRRPAICPDRFSSSRQCRDIRMAAEAWGSCGLAGCQHFRFPQR